MNITTTLAAVSEPGGLFDMDLGQLLTAAILGLVTGSLPAVLLFMLNRKGANKKLEIEESGSEVTIFTAQTNIYKDLLDRAQNREAEKDRLLSLAESKLNEAIKELDDHRDERSTLKRRLDELESAQNISATELVHTNEKLQTLRRLFTSYISRTGIMLTPEEQEVFESTVPSLAMLRKVSEEKPRTT